MRRAGFVTLISSVDLVISSVGIALGGGAAASIVGVFWKINALLRIPLLGCPS
jgi:hypothetical protein